MKGEEGREEELRFPTPYWCPARVVIRESFALIFGCHSESFVVIRGHSRVGGLLPRKTCIM